MPKPPLACFVPTRRALATSLLLAGLLSPGARAEYHSFNTPSGSDGVMQEGRWPYWAETTYNAIYSQTLSGSDGGSAYFYGGMPSDPGGTPPASIIWSFWPPSGTSIPGAAVTAYWTATNMYAPPHVGEGASGKVAGNWPLITTNQWYREVFRVWQPANGTPHAGLVGRWLRDPATGTWYHVATMSVPFAATGIAPLGGYQEDFGNGNRNPRRTDYRNVYGHKNGVWQAATQFTPSTRDVTENGSAGLIENATAAFFETCSGSNYLFSVVSNPPSTTGKLVLLVSTNYPPASLLTNAPAGILALGPSGVPVTLTLTNQPSALPADPMVVTAASALVSGTQLLAQWQLAPNSSPQFAYRLDVFNNAQFTGAPAVSVFDVDPEARQKLVDLTGVFTPYARLTLIDILSITNPPLTLTPTTAVLTPATNLTGTVSGLGYAYYETTTNFTVLPAFAGLTPVLQGAVDYPDLTPRRQRSHYAFAYTGLLTVPSDGLYTFTTTSSDGSRLIIDGQVVVNWDGHHSPAPLSGAAALQR